MTQNFETFQIQIQISASPADVLDAWLNPTKAKQWLAQEVEIEARPGGKFAFWGPSIMEATTKDLATQSLVSIEPGAFTFTWPKGRTPFSTRDCRCNSATFQPAAPSLKSQFPSLRA